MSLGFGILIVWLAYHYLPEARELLRDAARRVRAASSTV